MSFCHNLLAKLSPENTRPNVLFIIVDDLKPLLGCYEDPLAKTPNIDRLAENGMVFQHAYCAQAICGPSRASILTGMRPDNIRTWFMNQNSEYKLFRELNPGIITLPQLFKENGYTSIGVGKVFDTRNLTPEEDSISWSRKPAYFDAEGVAYALRRQLPDSGRFNPRYNGFRPSMERAEVDDEVYFDGMIAKRAVEFLNEFAATGKPFFLAVGFRRPHLPFTAPAKYWNMYDRDTFRTAVFRERAEGSPRYAYHNFKELRSYKDIPDDGPLDDARQLELIHAYYACVSFIDAQVGKILNQLERTEMARNTIVVLMGDHGWHLGDHGLWCKLTNFEESTRVPLIIAAPSAGVHGAISTSLVELTDVYPTLADLAGIAIPQEKDGTSLVPVLDDPVAEIKPVAISQFPRGKVMGYSYRSKRYRYVVWVEKDAAAGGPNGKTLARELYDYVWDPLERKNLVNEPEYGKIVDRFSRVADGTYRAVSSHIDFDQMDE